MAFRSSAVALAALCVLLASVPCRLQNTPRFTRAKFKDFHKGYLTTEIHKVFATSAHLLRFDYNLSTPDFLKDDQVFDKLQGVLSNLTEQAAVRPQIDSVTAWMKQTADRIDNHFTLMRKRHKKGPDRRRRASPGILGPIGTLFGNVFGFPAYEDVAMLEENDQAVLAYVDQVHAMVTDLRDVTRENNKAIRERDEEVQKELRVSSEALREVNALVRQGKNLAALASLLNSAIMTMTANKLLTAHHLTSIYSACAERKIPEGAVPIELLEAGITAAKDKYGIHAVDLAVRRVRYLYRLAIATCIATSEGNTEEADKLTVLVRLPMRDVDLRWRAYDVTPLAFAYRGQVCQLLPHPIAVFSARRELPDGDAEYLFRVMTPEQRTACLATDVCEVPRASAEANPAGVAGACVRGIMGNTPSHCEFTCELDQNVRVTHMFNNTYSVVNTAADLLVVCSMKEPVRLLPEPFGALLLTLPCDCQLRQVDGRNGRNRVLLDKVPCLPHLADDEPLVTQQVPSLWKWAKEVEPLMEQLASLESAPLEVESAKITETKHNVTIKLQDPDEKFEHVERSVLKSPTGGGAGASGSGSWWGSWLPTPPVWLITVWLAILTAFIFIVFRRQSSLQALMSMQGFKGGFRS